MLSSLSTFLPFCYPYIHHEHNTTTTVLVMDMTPLCFPLCSQYYVDRGSGIMYLYTPSSPTKVECTYNCYMTIQKASGCLSKYSGFLLVLQSIWAISVQLFYVALELTNSSSIRIKETGIDPGFYTKQLQLLCRVTVQLS